MAEEGREEGCGGAPGRFCEGMEGKGGRLAMAIAIAMAMMETVMEALQSHGHGRERERRIGVLESNRTEPTNRFKTV